MGTVLTLDPPLTGTLLDLYCRLADRSDLRPGSEVDELFGSLVRLVLSTPDDEAAALLADRTVASVRPELHALCSRGEFELELAWAHRIAASPAPHAELERFPYAGNYRALSRMELDVLATVVDRPVRRVAFLGSGPLPLSPVLVAGELGVPVDGIDRDEAAVTLARRVVEALGVPGVSFVHSDVADADLRPYDVVVLAALVGVSASEKRSVLRRLAGAMAPGAVLLARSARGMRSLLYPAIEPRALDGFDLQAIVHPVDEVINSVVLARAGG
jgi:hypothetical protein